MNGIDYVLGCGDERIGADRRDDPVACRGVESVLRELGMTLCVGPDPMHEGALGPIVSFAHEGSPHFSALWPENETLGVFLCSLLGRIWKQAFAAGKADAQTEMRSALGL